MSFVTDIVNLIRPPPPPAKPAKGQAPELPPPATVEELTAALGRLDEERAEANRIVLDVAKQRESLLLTPDSDDVILQLDGKVDRAHLFIERLDKLRPQLAGKLQELNARHRQEEWGRLVERYIAQGRSYAQLLAQAEEARWKLQEIRVEASRSFPYETDRTFPWLIDMARLGAADFSQVIEDIVQSGRGVFIPPPRADYSVRFRAWTPVGYTAYQAEQVAGFDAKTAWALVDAEKADWVELDRIPPRPAPPPPPSPEFIGTFGAPLEGDAA